ncbi:lasso peptide biosynthesis B2 protein [Streptomyces sp. NPDC059256]|uniref:lasso peptide biosynthesis B2 protein n=1 Tax=Streptomyces sp. NPDC059256 TaxID=3346794 RepID=UPI0036AFF2E0
MSMFSTPEPHMPVNARERAAALLATATARCLMRLSPGRLRRLLETLRHGAAPATAGQALAARQAVVTVSARCAGEGCLQRSVATVLLCRARGTWPTWCTGVRSDPFRAHAWVEVDGEPVGEPPSTALFHRILTVPGVPVGRQCVS